MIVEPHADAALRALLGSVQGDSRLLVIVNRGRGLAGAFNTGMRAAQTEFVAILLSDDLWAPNAVEVLSAHIGAFPEIDLHHSALRVVDEARRPLKAPCGIRRKKLC